MIRSRALLHFVTGSVFVGNFILGTVAFLLFLNWYDVGSFVGEEWKIAAISGFFWGCFALLIEKLLYKRYKYWPKNQFFFFVRVISMSVFYVTLSYSTSYSTYLLISQVRGEESVFNILTDMMVIAIMGVFYLPMIIPFGTLVGLVNGLLLKYNRPFHWS